MNREIKFRAWNKDTRKMYEVLILGDDYIEAKCSTQPMLLEHVELMQCAGLKDKNDVEVYEGDIVQMYYQPMHEFGHKKRTTTKFKRSGHNEYTSIGEMLDIRVIKWIRGALMLHCKDGATGHMKSFNNLASPGESFEVIGNIHQNPELIEA